MSQSAELQAKNAWYSQTTDEVVSTFNVDMTSSVVCEYQAFFACNSAD